MHSNLITPPDLLDNELYTITLINATTNDIDLLTHIVESTAECYNVYLYADAMADNDWLQQAINQSKEIIINSDVAGHDERYLDSRTWYYGARTLLAPARKLDSLMQYFLYRNQLANK